MKYTKYINYFIIALTFFYLLYLSWLRWGNLTIDTFRDPWFAYKIIEGNIMYKDFFYLFGFFPLYFMSFFYRIFGINIHCFIFIGILVTFISTILIYRISRLFLNRAFSTLVILNFLFVFAFGCYSYTGIFNFILPYSIASTFFIMFVFSAVLFFIKFIKKEKSKYLFWWGVSLYFAFLSRPWMSLVIWVVFLVLAIIYTFRDRKFFLVCYFFLPALLSLFSYWFFLYISDGFIGFKESMTSALSLSGRGEREAMISGFANFYQGLMGVAKSFFYQIAAVALLYVGCTSLFSIIRRAKMKLSRFTEYTITAALSLSVCLYLLKLMHHFDQYLLMPLLIVLGICSYFFRFMFGKDTYRKEYFSLFALFSIAFILILRIVFTATPNHYGFFLLPIGLICYYIFFVRLYPSFLDRIISMDKKRKECYFFGLAVMLILLVFPFAKRNYVNYLRKNFIVITERGSIRSFNDTLTLRFWEAVLYLKENTSTNSTVFVLPQGESINFFSSRDNPTRYRSIYPKYFKMFSEDSFVDMLNENKIDYILLLNRFFFEYGGQCFGRDYGEEAYSWIRDNYKLIKTIGAYPCVSNEFGIAIFKRK